MFISFFVIVFRSAQEAQERRDYELALRLAAVSIYLFQLGNKDLSLVK